MATGRTSDGSGKLVQFRQLRRDVSPPLEEPTSAARGAVNEPLSRSTMSEFWEHRRKTRRASGRPSVTGMSYHEGVVYPATGAGAITAGTATGLAGYYLGHIITDVSTGGAVSGIYAAVYGGATGAGLVAGSAIYVKTKAVLATEEQGPAAGAAVAAGAAAAGLAAGVKSYAAGAALGVAAFGAGATASTAVVAGSTAVAAGCVGAAMGAKAADYVYCALPSKTRNATVSNVQSRSAKRRDQWGVCGG